VYDNTKLSNSRELITNEYKNLYLIYNIRSSEHLLIEVSEVKVIKKLI